jgi:hypothetical protein
MSARTHARIRTDAHCFTPGNFKKNATVRPSHGRPRGHRPTVRPSENVRVTTLAGHGSFRFCSGGWWPVWGGGVGGSKPPERPKRPNHMTGLRIELAKSFEAARQQISTVSTNVNALKKEFKMDFNSLSSEFNALKTDLKINVKLIKKEIEQFKTDVKIDVKLIKKEIEQLKTDVKINVKLIKKEMDHLKGLVGIVSFFGFLCNAANITDQSLIYKAIEKRFLLERAASQGLQVHVGQTCKRKQA